MKNSSFILTPVRLNYFTFDIYTENRFSMLLRYTFSFHIQCFSTSIFLVYFMYKKELLNKIIEHLHSELSSTELAAKNAHLAATDDQSVAETQYDTLAIEASYLAEGQSRRVEEIKHSLALFEQLSKNIPQNVTIVNIGSLVQLEQDKQANAWFYIGPAAGGFRCEIEEHTFTVITPQSPVGQALMNKEEGDEINIRIGDILTTDYINSIM